MPGTASGGRKADATIRERYGDDWRVKTARAGGLSRTANTHKKGFGSMSRERLQELGHKGGSTTRQKRDLSNQ